MYLSISYLVSQLTLGRRRSRAKTAADFLLFSYATSVRIGWRDPTADGLLAVIIIDFTLDFSGFLYVHFEWGLSAYGVCHKRARHLGLGGID